MRELMLLLKYYTPQQYLTRKAIAQRLRFMTLAAA
jgi:hypothetical protein